MQEALRPHDCHLAIEDEYPLVLSSLHADRSFCLSIDGQMVGHANLLLREIRDRSGVTCGLVALVGNVATALKFRGQGFMRILLGEVEAKARAQGAQAMILWSDLDSFYQKLGFKVFGEELRVSFQTGSLPENKDFLFSRLPHDASVASLLAMRACQVPSPERTEAEFRQLLKMPLCEGLLAFHNQQAVAYAIMGKGWDMGGVIHEWGCFPGFERALLPTFRKLGSDADLNEVMVLVPKEGIGQAIKSTLLEHPSTVSTHPIGLLKSLEDRPLLKEVYFWGLDSI